MSHIHVHSIQIWFLHAPNIQVHYNIVLFSFLLQTQPLTSRYHDHWVLQGLTEVLPVLIGPLRKFFNSWLIIFVVFLPAFSEETTLTKTKHINQCMSIFLWFSSCIFSPTDAVAVVLRVGTNKCGQFRRRSYWDTNT